MTTERSATASRYARVGGHPQRVTRSAPPRPVPTTSITLRLRESQYGEMRLPDGP
jgi:hypothetical protein